MTEIVLKDFQKPHYKKLVDIATDHCCVLDVSKPGLGKSIIASLFAKESGVKSGLVICPTNIEPDWNQRIISYKLPISKIISYQSLRGTIECQPKHGLLFRDSYGNFHPTPNLCSMIENGFILILDEIMYIKNNCDQSKAVKAIASYITRRMMTKPYPKIKSYIYSISSSPFDSEESTIQYFITMGIITNSKLYDKISCSLLGASDLFNYSSFFNKKEVDYILSHNEISSRTISNLCYKVCKDILLPIMSSAMIKNEEKKHAKQSIFYGYFDIPKEGHDLIKLGISMIHKSMKKKDNPELTSDKNEELINLFSCISLNSDPEKHNINTFDFEKMGGITHGMITIQSAKSLYIVVPLVKKIFASVHNVKIVLFFDNKNPLKIAEQHLSEFNPVSITGERSKDERKTIIDKFQEANCDSRLLLFISSLGESGIELDDTSGNYPRIGIGMPGFSMVKILQIAGRFNRENTKSNSLFFWVYSKSDEYCEQSVINSIERKSKVLCDTLNNDIITPNMYKKMDESEINDFNELLRNAGTEIKPVVKEQVIKKKVIYIESSCPSLF